MNWKFGSAGRIICSRRAFLILILTCFPACNRQQPSQTPDPRLAQLQNDVRKLSEENQQLQQEIQTLRAQLSAQQTQTASATSPADSITVERVKKEVAPVLKEAIERIKKNAETAKTGGQFGMRIEYDLKNAVYGLVMGDSGDPPYAKVIVGYEKFLESNNSSRSYGNGSTTFVFAFRNNEWILQSYQ